MQMISANMKIEHVCEVLSIDLKALINRMKK